MNSNHFPAQNSTTVDPLHPAPEQYHHTSHLAPSPARPAASVPGAPCRHQVFPTPGFALGVIPATGTLLPDPCCTCSLFLRWFFSHHPIWPRRSCPPSPGALRVDCRHKSFVACGINLRITKSHKAGIAEVMYFHRLLLYSLFLQVCGFISH